MSAEEWYADIPINTTLVKNCLQAQFPKLMPIKKIKYMGEGWDNKVFLVNNEFIFRFPRRKIAAALIERENKVLNNLPEFLGVNVPIPEYIGHPTPAYPYAFQGYKVIKGVPGYQAQLSPQERFASLRVLAGFLKQLHSIDESRAASMGAQPQVFDRTIITKTVATLNERVAKIMARNICVINQACFQQEVTAIEALALPAANQCLVHGDLDCRHLIFNHQRLAGVIDWGDMGINNRSVDLAIIWSFYPSSCHQQFFSVYGAVEPATWQYARFLGLYSAFTLMLYGQNIGDALLVEEAISAVSRINAALLSK